MATSALRIEGLRHRYGPTPVLDGVDLEVRSGELVAVLGASGCGKTTLLRCVAGLAQPTGGRIALGEIEVVVDGRERVPAERRGIGLVFQDYALFGSLSVYDNVAYGARDGTAIARELLERVGLPDVAARFPSELSGGQQQRVALARALAVQPRLLLLDEPFANVDAERRADLGATLRSVMAAEGCAGLLVTHDRMDALGLADRVLVLESGPDGGRVGQVGTPEEVYLQPASRAVARLTGTAAFVEGVADGGRVATPFGEVPVAAEGPGWLVVRPETVEVGESGAAGTVVTSMFLGGTTQLVIDGPTGRVFVRHPDRLAPGTAVRLRLAQPAAWVER